MKSAESVILNVLGHLKLLITKNIPPKKLQYCRKVLKTLSKMQESKEESKEEKEDIKIWNKCIDNYDMEIGLSDNEVKKLEELIKNATIYYRVYAEKNTDCIVHSIGELRIFLIKEAEDFRWDSVDHLYDDIETVLRYLMSENMPEVEMFAQNISRDRFKHDGFKRRSCYDSHSFRLTFDDIFSEEHIKKMLIL
jgi:hypothetical protein